MVTLRKGLGLLTCSLAALSLSHYCAAEDKPVFDQGEKYDLEHHITTHDPKESDAKNDETKKKAIKARNEKLAHAVAYHVKNLKDPDADVRQSSCEMLGALAAPEAVEPLIEVLNPVHKEHINVMLSAHGALVKITNQNFGYKNYDMWASWWRKNKLEFTRKAETGPDETAKISASAANTIGLGYLSRGEHRQAQAQFLTAIDKDPNVPDYHNNLGLSLIEQGRYLDAMEYFQETIGLDRDLPQPYMNIGRCYSRMDRSIEAQNWYKQAIEKDKEGKLWDLPWMIGKEYMRRAEWSMAKEYIDQAVNKMLKKGIRDPRVYNDLAITHFGLDQYHSAWRDLTDIRTLGYEPNPEFVAKVKKQLLDEGIDPEAEDTAARLAARKAANPNPESVIESNGPETVTNGGEAPRVPASNPGLAQTSDEASSKVLESAPPPAEKR
jgi:tetratricopeptide (TPR) repeat protein